MTGWVTPPGTPSAGTPDGPIVGWVTPSEPEGLGIREASGEGWALTRRHLGSFAAIAAVPLVILNVASIPIWLSVGRSFEQMVTFWVNLDWSRYRNDPEALQRDMQTAIQPSTDLALIGAIGAGVAFVVWMLGAAALSAATLDAADGRRPSVTGAYRAVAAHAGALVLPALALGLGYVLVVAPLSLIQPGRLPAGELGASTAVNALLSFVILIAEIGVVYLAVRWSLYFQVVIAEDTSIRRGLSRSAELTSGARIKIALIGIVLAIGIGIVVGFLAVMVGFIVGVAAASFSIGLFAYSVALSICGLVYLPFFAAVLTYIYRRRSMQEAVAGATSA